MTSAKLKLFQKAQNNPAGITFKDVQKLAEFYGFIFDSKNSSHVMFKRHDDPYGFMNFQPRPNEKRMAKIYQVRQLVKFIIDNGLEE